MTVADLGPDELLTTTRSVRKRLDLGRPVPLELVRECLEVGRQGLQAGNQAGAWGSLLPAAWSYMLAARARGLATAWTTLHLTYEDEVAGLLGIPSDVRQGALIPTAYALGSGFRPAARRPLDEVLHVDGW
jgi:nitroreductase